MFQTAKFDLGIAGAYVTPQELSQIFRETYSLGSIKNCIGLGGNANCNLKIGTFEGPEYFIKIVLEHPEENVYKQVAFERFVTAQGLKVPEYLVGDEGKVAHTVSSGKLLLIQKMAEGAHPSITGPVCFEIGKQLGKLHSLNPSNLPEKEHWMTVASSERLLAEISEFKDQELIAKLSDRFTHLRSYVHSDSLQRVIIHGDTHRENVFFLDDKLSAWFDWEEVGIASAIIDLGLSSLYLSFEGSVFLKQNFFNLLAGYETERRLQPIEKAHLVDAMEYATLTACCWRIAQHGIKQDNPGELGIVYKRMSINFEEINTEVMKLL